MAEAYGSSVEELLSREAPTGVLANGLLAAAGLAISNHERIKSKIPEAMNRPKFLLKLKMQLATDALAVLLADIVTDMELSPDQEVMHSICHSAVSQTLREAIRRMREDDPEQEIEDEPG